LSPSPADHAAGRGPCRARWRSASRRAFRRASSATTFAGRPAACFGRAATRTRCRCISPPLVLFGLCLPRGRAARRRGLLDRRYREGSVSSAGGIRTRDLELMRLARTAAPLPRGVSAFIRCTQIVYATRLRFGPGSALAVLRGGALEPRSSRGSTNWQAKSAAYSAAGIYPRRTEGSFSLSGGASSVPMSSSSWASPLHSSVSPPKRRRRPVGSPSIRWLCG
jgi:hypothetical protein